MTEQKVDTVRLQNLSRAFIHSASFFSAIDLGLFTAVAEGHDTVEAFAEHAGITALNAERLMTMCGSLGLIEWRGDRFVNAPDVARFLVEGSSSYAGAWMLFIRASWSRWGSLTEKLRATGTPDVVSATSRDMTVDAARAYHRATSSVGFGPEGASRAGSICRSAAS